MLVKPTMESLLKKVESRYTLSILAAKRARQLVNGARPLSTSDTPNYVTLACEEIVKGEIVCIKGIHQEVFIPLRPEIAAERLAARVALENARMQEALEETFSKVKVTDLDDEEDILIESEEEIDILDSEIEDIDSLISKFIPSDDEVINDIIVDDIDFLDDEESLPEEEM